MAVTGKKTATQNHSVEIPPQLSVRELSELMEVTSVSLIKQLMRGGIMANINQVLDFQLAGRLASSFGYEVRRKAVTKRAGSRRPDFDELSAGSLKPRPPVVTIMGHVDHGKTRILDVIRQTKVMESEAGGITQHIGAYQVEVNDHRITFLDTPGHEAFTTMRARGAQLTDIAVLVVAADDGVMPQTLEAIDHAKAAGVPIVVAMNKMDKDNANPDRVKQQLAANLLIEEWGGEVVLVPTSAKNGDGIDTLLETLLLVAEIEDLKTDPRLPAGGVVIESRMDKQRGPMATVLVQTGILRVGDIAVIGGTWGKIKAMYNYAGKQIKKSGPSTPVQLLGLASIAQVGDILKTFPSEQQARNTVQKRIDAAREQSQGSRLQTVLDQINKGKVKDFNVVLKADVQGSLEPIRTSLEQLSNEEVKVRVIHSGTGNITGSDVMLGATSSGLVVGFNVSAETGARRVADVEGVDIRSYAVIYDVIDDVSKILRGMVEPTYVDVIDGHAEVRNIFSTTKKGRVAGVYVTEGKIARSHKVRVLRGKEIVCETTVASLKRFKDDASEVAAGYECGVGLNDFTDYAEGDILEFYHREAKFAA